MSDMVPEGAGCFLLVYAVLIGGAVLGVGFFIGWLIFG